MPENTSSDMQYDFEEHIPMQVANASPNDVIMMEPSASIDPLSDHGLVDLNDFKALDTWVHVLEGTIQNINITLTQLSTLFKTFMEHYLSSHSSGFPNGGAPHDVSPHQPPP